MVEPMLYALWEFDGKSLVIGKAWLVIHNLKNDIYTFEKELFLLPNDLYTTIKEQFHSYMLKNILYRSLLCRRIFESFLPRQWSVARRPKCQSCVGLCIGAFGSSKFV